MRRLLLGGGSDDDDEGVGQDSDDEIISCKGKVNGKSKNSKATPKDNFGDAGEEDKGFNDDFFMDDGEGEEKKETSQALPAKSRKGKGDDILDKSFTYVPDAEKQKKEADHSLDETPFETMQRKLTEKRKARKAAKKLLKNDVTSVAEDIEGSKLPKKFGKGKKEEVERTAATTAELELLLSDDDEGYDMRAIHKEEMEIKKGSKGKRKR